MKNSFWIKTDLGSIAAKHLTSFENLWIFDGKSINEQVLLLGHSSESQLVVTQLARNLIDELSVTGVPITVVLSKKVKNAPDIGLEIQFCRALLKKNLIFGKSSILSVDRMNVITSQELCIFDAALERKLYALAHGHQKDLFFNEIDKLLAQWEKNSFSQSTIEKLLKQIVSICRKVLIDQLDIINDPDLEIDEIVSVSKDYNALALGLRFIFNRFLLEPNSLKRKGDSSREAVERIEMYLKTHFSEQITINDIADKLYMDSSYLGRIFKGIKGVSPMEYLTNLRIEKAKELISGDSKLMLKEIAEIVGYSEQYYFSRIFKIITGLSPSDYKNSLTNTKL